MLLNQFKVQSSFLSKSLAKNVCQRYQYKTKALYFYERGYTDSVSGIRATIFGGTSFMGPFIGQELGNIGSDLIFPHNHSYIFDQEVKKLPLCARHGRAYVLKHMDFDDLDMIDRVVKNSNVVINLIGPKRQVKKLEEAEYINITIAKRIAQACAKNPNVLRLIHFSACGVNPRSDSIDFRTKYHGEQEVMNAFPNATILRPTSVYGLNDYLIRLFIEEFEFFYNFNIVTDDCQAKRQPIHVHDIALCVLNALKLPETAGKTYELGGPHVYTRLELFQLMNNMIMQPPKLIHIPFHVLAWVARKIPNWDHFSLEGMIKDKLDIIVTQKNNTIKDLYVQPVSFAYGALDFLEDYKLVAPGSEDNMIY